MVVTAACAPSFPVDSGRVFNHSDEATKSSNIFGPFTWRNFTAPCSSPCPRCSPCPRWR